MSLPFPVRRSGRRVLAPALILFFVAARPSPQGDPRTVAMLETRAPVQLEFLLRGTVPVPPHIYPRSDGLSPFTILDYDGTPRPTQVEIVSRYPNDPEGADVVELLARVHRAPGVTVDAPVRYAVVLDISPSAPPLDDLQPVPEVVRDYLLDPLALEIRATDCFGNRYVSRPLGGVRELSVLHHGPVQAELRVYQDMLPEPALPGSTLPHLFGIHAYLSWFRDSTTVGLDLRFHNGHDGHDKNDERDDPLDTIYFRELELSMPEAWTVQQDFPDPLFGSERIENGRRIVALVAPEPGGGLHVMRWLAQFHRRLALSPAQPVDVALARTYLDAAGRAFCVRGFVLEGREYWSWWNEKTSRYFPQRHQLPRLDNIGKPALENDLRGQLSLLATHLADGTSVGDYPIAAPRLGWGHPYGVDYGGMTGGLEIDCYDGVSTAAAASQSGYRMYTALHRMATDRQPNALYRLDGEPSSVEEWLIENGDTDYVPFEQFVVPLTFGSRPDPFGVRNAPHFQVDYVRAHGLQPAYESRHFSFDPYDYQHFIRYTRAAKVLVWLGNDSLAADDLRMEAENFHLSYNANANEPGGNAQSSGLLSAMRYVAQFPGQGCPYGRGEAWGLDCAVAAYSSAAPDWRARKLPWFEQQAEFLLAAQSSCNGFIQSFVSNKAVDGKYQARQQIEQSITENALVGLNESVFRGADAGHAQMVRDVLVKSLRAFIGEMAWFPGQPGPWRYTGVAPLDPHLPPWCSRAEMPNDAWTAGDIETYQDWSSFAYGYELTGDTLFLRHARFQTGGTNFNDLVMRLRSAGTDNLENRAALLTVIQRITGEL